MSYCNLNPPPPQKKKPLKLKEKTEFSSWLAKFTMVITSLCVTRLSQTIVLHVSKCILDWKNVLQSTVKDFLL